MAEALDPAESPPSLSFSGSGFLALYQIGAVKALSELAPQILKSAPKVYGASAGSLVAAAVVFKANLDEFQNTLFEAAKEAGKPFLPFSPKFNLITILQKSMLKFVPDDAHHLATGRLHVALTRLSDGKKYMISDYRSKEEVMQALVCSCFVPIYCGLLSLLIPWGVRYIDGGLTSFQPLFGETSMITVSPFSGEIDICPRDCPVSHSCLHVFNTSFQVSVENLSRVSYSLFPPSLSILNDFYCQGFRDATLYINTTRRYKTQRSELLTSNQDRTLFRRDSRQKCKINHVTATEKKKNYVE
ncbi:LOW QUALITY PROTEIN: omega-hydroxyceramide transacylase-like [Discoglossus pictus]